MRGRRDDCLRRAAGACRWRGAEGLPRREPAAAVGAPQGRARRRLRCRAGRGGRGQARPAAEDPVVRKQARRGFQPGAGSQCAALRRPLRAGRQLCPDDRIRWSRPASRPQNCRISKAQQRRPPAPRRARRAGAEPALHLCATDRRARTEGARQAASPASPISPGCASRSRAERSATPS